MAEYILLRRVQTPTQVNTVSGTASGEVSTTSSVVVQPSPSAEVGTWSEVQLGTGSLSGARRIITPAPGMYPNETGVSFWKDDVFNRTDATGPNEDSVYHFFPNIDLVGGEVLRAEWVDVNGVSRQSIYSVPLPPPTPATASGVIGVSGPAIGPLSAPTGFPDATTTGLSNPDILTASGTVSVSTDGAVIENLDITGALFINANNVTVRNCRITNTTAKYIIQIGLQNSGIVLEDLELDGRMIATHGIVHSGYVARRINMYAVGDGFRIGGGCIIEDSWVHDLGHNGYYDPSPHFDAVQSVGGSGFIIRRNRLEGPWRQQTSAIILKADFGNITDVLVEDNLLSGGTYTLYVRNAAYQCSNVQVNNNVWVRDSWAFGPLSQNAGTSTYTGNTYDDGAPF